MADEDGEETGGKRPPVCIALRHLREEADLTQDQLAGRMNLAQSSIQKWEGRREPKLDRIAALEEAMGYPRGHVLRLAGYVKDATTVREALLADPNLTPDLQELLLSFYDGAARLSSKDRSARSANAPPTKATKPRSSRRRRSS